MTTLTIKSNSERKILLLVQLAEELGLSINVDSFDEAREQTITSTTEAEIEFAEDTNASELEKNFFRYMDN